MCQIRTYRLLCPVKSDEIITLACDISPSEQFYFGEGNRVIHYYGGKAAQPSVVFEDFTHAGYYTHYRPPTGQFFVWLH